MCKKCNKKHTNTNKKDICMESVCWLINNRTNYKTLACCCGHGKYPMTIICKWGELNLEKLSYKGIPRNIKFYKKDKGSTSTTT